MKKFLLLALLAPMGLFAAWGDPTGEIPDHYGNMGPVKYHESIDSYVYDNGSLIIKIPREGKIWLNVRGCDHCIRNYEAWRLRQILEAGK